MPSWQAKANGNPGNDLGDSNLIADYGAGWCGALTGTNAAGARGFVLAYARHGRGTIIYDGVDFDQFANIAYRQYVTRQLALPFDPDPLPCSSRIAPFVITTEGRHAQPPGRAGRNRHVSALGPLGARLQGHRRAQRARAERRDRHRLARQRSRSATSSPRRSR